jgi:hypothetical protein
MTRSNGTRLTLLPSPLPAPVRAQDRSDESSSPATPTMFADTLLWKERIDADRKCTDLGGDLGGWGGRTVASTRAAMARAARAEAVLHLPRYSFDARPYARSGGPIGSTRPSRDGHGTVARLSSPNVNIRLSATAGSCYSGRPRRGVFLALTYIVLAGPRASGTAPAVSEERRSQPPDASAAAGSAAGTPGGRARARRRCGERETNRATWRRGCHTRPGTPPVTAVALPDRSGRSICGVQGRK